MEIRADFLDMATRFGGALLDGIVARDNLHLAPTHVRPGAATRIRQGIRRLEAYLKRLILLMALRMEHLLPADVERQIYLRPSSNRAKTASLTVFSPQFDEGQTLGFTWRWDTPTPYRVPGADVPAFELLKTLSFLRALLDNPQPRAKRLAWHLARRRHGWLPAPAAHIAIPGRFGTEASATFDAMKSFTQAASLARPTPRGPPAKATAAYPCYVNPAPPAACVGGRRCWPIPRARRGFSRPSAPADRQRQARRWHGRRANGPPIAE